MPLTRFFISLLVATGFVAALGAPTALAAPSFDNVQQMKADALALAERLGAGGVMPDGQPCTFGVEVVSPPEGEVVFLHTPVGQWSFGMSLHDGLVRRLEREREGQPQRHYRVLASDYLSVLLGAQGELRGLELFFLGGEGSYTCLVSGGLSRRP